MESRIERCLEDTTAAAYVEKNARKRSHAENSSPCLLKAWPLTTAITHLESSTAPGREEVRAYYERTSMPWKSIGEWWRALRLRFASEDRAK